MENKYIQKIADTLQLRVRQVENVSQLHQEGATIPFMARYRKEATGNMDEVQIGGVVEKIKYFNELDKRKETILKTIEGLGKLTPALKARIENSFEATELEDIYLPYKPKRKTRATVAMEKGLEPLARIIFEQQETGVEVLAEQYVNVPAAARDAAVQDSSAVQNPAAVPDSSVVQDPSAVADPGARGKEESLLIRNVEEALQGARDIIAEWIAEDEQARNAVRHLFTRQALVSSKVLKAKKDAEEAQKYKDYFEFSEPLAQCPSHRMLAIRRGEKEGFLSMDISIGKEDAQEALKKIFIKAGAYPFSASQMIIAIEDGFERLLQSSIENEFRLIAKTNADEEAIRVFAENLRQLLLASPLGSKRVMALDPGFRTGCKAVCLDAQGNLLYNTAIYPHPPQMETAASITELKRMAEKYEVEAIGIGNGTAGRETEQLIRGIDFGRHISIFMVNESGASIYSASEVAREEFPDQDVTVRGAVSIGRRLLDPLSELVKIDAKSIGVGQYQHDVNQNKLKEELDRVVESCVNHVGVNLNTASRHLLGYVSGLSATLAKNIVEYRLKNGPFRSREEMTKVAMMGPKSFEQSAGFLRIPEAENPLDNSAVHPESYFVVRQMAKDLGCPVEELMRDSALRKKVDLKSYISEKAGEYTIEDILKELEKPGRDPRSHAEEFRFDDTLKTIEDVKPGMTVPGIVTNITNFGAFVDIGVKQDGLVHISQMSNTYITDPNQAVKLNQHVMVAVMEVDVARKRISLSMKTQASAQASKTQTSPARAPKAKTGNNPQRGNKNPEPLNDFQSKLMELKKKFKDI